LGTARAPGDETAGDSVHDQQRWLLYKYSACLLKEVSEDVKTFHEFSIQFTRFT
jgi:hypothetical protein